MSEKHIVVQGATCKCKFSVEPKTDKLKVKTQTKHYANVNEGGDKLIASDKEIGQTLEKNTFGKCKKQPAGNDFLPCQAQITKWSGTYEKMILSNQGKVLLEDSKATCPMGAPDCIEITKHGQVTETSEQNFKNANPMVHNLINPMVDVRNMNKKESTHKGMEDSEDEVKGNHYYSMTGEYIGADGRDDTKKFMAINKKAQNELEKQAKSGTVTVDIESKNPGLFPVVSQAEIDAMIKLYNKTENDLVEVGMVGGTNSKKERVFAIELNVSKSAAFDGTGKLARDLNAKHYPVTLEYNVHTHPPIFYFIETDADGSDKYIFGVNSASKPDKSGTLGSYKIAIVLGWEIDQDADKLDVITKEQAKKNPNTWVKNSPSNIGEKKIDFYNNTKDIGEMKFSDFMTAQQKANTHKI
jgi:hypothetical protein